MTQSSVAHETFVIDRSYDVPVAQVFRAWAEPKLKARWFAGSADARRSGNGATTICPTEAERTFVSVGGAIAAAQAATTNVSAKIPPTMRSVRRNATSILLAIREFRSRMWLRRKSTSCSEGWPSPAL